MKKTIVSLLGAATIVVMVAATTTDASAWWKRGWGWGPGIAAGVVGGAVIAGAIIASRPPGYVVYDGYAAPVYGPGCYWASRPVYDGAGRVVGYTGQPVQVCPGYTGGPPPGGPPGYAGGPPAGAPGYAGGPPPGGPPGYAGGPPAGAPGYAGGPPPGYAGGPPAGAPGYAGGAPGYVGPPDYAGGPPAGDPVASCMQRFRSYDPKTGTYLGNDGQRHSCP
jgi:hypothetical protein